MKMHKLVTVVALLGGVVCVQSAFATEQAHQRRDARETRQDGLATMRAIPSRTAVRTIRRATPIVARDKRGEKQDAREAGRDIKY